MMFAVNFTYSNNKQGHAYYKNTDNKNVSFIFC